MRAWSHRFIKDLAHAVTALFAGALAASIVGLVWATRKFGIDASSIELFVVWMVVAGTTGLLIRRQAYFPAIALVSAARLGVYFLTGGAIPGSPDPQFYDSLARSLAHGHELAYVIDGISFYAHAPRLHAYLLAAVFYLTSNSPWAPLIANGLIDTCTAAILFSAAMLAGRGRQQAALVSAAYMLWPHVLLNSVFAQKESLACMLLTACAFVAWRSWHDRKVRAIFYGAPLGLLAFTQPAFFLLAASFQLILAFRMKRSDFIRMVVVSALTAAAVMTPWIVRNWIIVGGFVPLTTGAGMNAYVNVAGTYDFPDGLAALPEAEWSRQMLVTAFHLIAANPAGYALHELKMMAVGFGLQHDSFMVWLTMVPRPRIAAASMILLTQASLILLWAGATFLSIKRREDAFFVSLFALVVLNLATVAIWFEFGARHRAYMLPLVLLWTAVTSWSRADRQDQLNS